MIRQAIQSSKWAQFYINRFNDEYYRHVYTKYFPFIKEIEKHINHGSHVVEVGCGMANITRFLIENRQVKFTTTLVDNDMAMIWLSYCNIEKLSPFLVGTTAKFVQGDVVRGCPQGDVVHSHGLLEHFEDHKIRLIIEHQLRNFKTLIHYVPSYKYVTPSFGDERLMTPKQWQTICNPDEIIEFNDGYDLILKWSR